MKPLVSVLIPVYNRENIISKTLDSVLSQTYNDLEIIVFDNASTDNTWKIIERYKKSEKRIISYRNDMNVGPALNLKYCIEKANGFYAKILFSDDIVIKDYIELSVNKFNNDVAFVLTGYQIIDEKNTLYTSSYQYHQFIKTEDYFNDILTENKSNFPYSPSNGLFRLNDVKKYYKVHLENDQNLDFKKYGAGNDLLLFLDIAKNYKYINLVNIIGVSFYLHLGSLSVNKNLSSYYFWVKYYFIVNFKPELLMKYRVLTLIYKQKDKELEKIYCTIKGRISIKTACWGAIFLLKLLFRKKLNGGRNIFEIIKR